VPETVNGAKTVQPDRPKFPMVVVDAGHGGRDPGAVRTYGSGRVRVQIQEKDLNLDVALEVSRLLRDGGVPVVMTRTDDSTVSLDERVRIADQTNPALMVSIHADAEKKQTGNASGFTVYVGENALPASLVAAKGIERRLAKTGVYGRGVRRHEKPLRVLVKPKCPSVLVEMGYLSNEREAAKLRQAHYRLMLAKAIAEGIMDFLKEAKK
jgi:N-acetylmuramoyl-L-alanine amidase